MIKFNSLIDYLLIGPLIVHYVLATASLKKADYDFNFWFYETQKNTNLTLIDRRVYEFDNFSARLPLANQTVLYQNLKEQLNHLVVHMNELCKDACMVQACKVGNDEQTYVKGIFKMNRKNFMDLIY